MLGHTPIILLDEPSNGMDAVARKLLWSVIQKYSTESKVSTVIVTSNSIEEAFCQKIGIMVKGEFRCIGNSSYIKKKYYYVHEI